MANVAKLVFSLKHIYNKYYFKYFLIEKIGFSRIKECRERFVLAQNPVLKKELELLRVDKSDLQERYDNLSLTAVRRNFEDEAIDTESENEEDEYKLTPLEVGNVY
jgi:hypothetical protein